MSAQYPVVTVDSVPAVGQVPAATDAPFMNQGYRTITSPDIDAAVVGHIGHPSISSVLGLSLYYAEQYLTSTYGPVSGSLIDTTGAVPVLTSADAHAVEYDANGLPIIGAVASGVSVGDDAELLWLSRTFGKR